MHALLEKQEAGTKSLSKLTTIFPILTGKPYPEEHGSYPATGNFFVDGSSLAISEHKLVQAVSPATLSHTDSLSHTHFHTGSLTHTHSQVSPATTHSVVSFLEKNAIPVSDSIRARTVSATVSSLLALQVFKLPWREAGPPNHHDDKVDSDQ